MFDARDIAAALRGARSGSGWIARCPAHHDRTPSLSITDGEDGRVLVCCHAGCEQAAVIDALRSLGLWEGNDAPRPAVVPFNPRPRRNGADASAKADAARALWARARPVAGTLAHDYLRARGLTIDPPPCLRFLPDAKHAPSGQRLPCLVAAVEGPRGGVVAIQRTFLAPDGNGKASVEPAKMALGAIDGGAVRLAGAQEWLALCEGVEDGLSVMEADPSLPVWATLGTGGLRSVVLPAHVRDVVILADADRAGEAAAQNAARRFLAEGRRARIARPPTPFKDFNDALRGANAIAGAA